MDYIDYITYQPIAVTYLMIMPLNFKRARNTIMITQEIGVLIQNIFPPKFRSNVHAANIHIYHVTKFAHMWVK